VLRQEAGVEVRLESGERGAFEVVADGVLIFSKKATGRFPNDAEILALLGRG